MICGFFAVNRKHLWVEGRCVVCRIKLNGSNSND